MQLRARRRHRRSGCCGRGWPSCTARGASRATMARRASSARVFTGLGAPAMACRRPTRACCSPRRRARRPLPEVLRVDEAAAVMRAAAEDDVSPLGLRNAAIVELLYATGARVSELCGLGRRRPRRRPAYRPAARQGGQGAHGSARASPPRRGRRSWLARGRPALATATSGPALLLGARGARIDPRTARRVVHQRLAAVDGRGRSRTSWAATHGRHTPSGGWRGPEERPGIARSRYARYNADLHTCVHRATKGHV